MTALAKSIRPLLVPGLCVVSGALFVAYMSWALIHTKAPITSPQASIAPTTPKHTMETATRQQPKKQKTAKKPAPKPSQPGPTPKTPSPTVPAGTLTYAQASSLTVVVNKKHPLPSGYTPPLVTIFGAPMRQEAATGLQSLFNAAQAKGISPKVISSFRSYATQQSVYQSYVATDGQTLADTYSARPGYSEHQTGLAVDVGGGGCDLQICFGNTAFGSWLKTHAHLYGFIIRYPQGKESITGYQYEPWHIRYVGTAVATDIYAKGVTLDQYYGVTAGGY